MIKVVRCLNVGLYIHLIVAEVTPVFLLKHIIPVILLGIAVWLSFHIVSRQRFITYRLLNIPWFYVTMGLCLWFIAKNIEILYVLWLSFFSEISIADLLYLLGYVFFIIGLYRGIRFFSQVVKEVHSLKQKIKYAYIIPLLIGSLFLGTFLTNIKFILIENPIILILNILYFVLDLLLLMFSLEVSLIFYGGEVARGFIVLSLGLALLSLCELQYFLVGSWLFDILYMVSHVFITLGVYTYSESMPIF